MKTSYSIPTKKKKKKNVFFLKSDDISFVKAQKTKGHSDLNMSRTLNLKKRSNKHTSFGAGI